uniref:SFRICE_019245 n=1 Tax=Spodoptera frugiperda TaxID=7108 RepID=A0A2H1VXQ6_SPOFR
MVSNDRPWTPETELEALQVRCWPFGGIRNLRVVGESGIGKTRKWGNWASALPYDPVIRKLDDGQRYQYMEGPDGALHLVDLWGKVSDVTAAARYDPDRQNVYHLYTRNNPTVSQPLLIGSEGLLGITNYNPSRRTVVLIHGWLDSVTADFNSVLVPAFLQAEDVNVIVVDWSAGAGTINYFTAVENTLTSGQSVARFITWLNGATGAVPSMYHLVGHSLGGHQVGIVGRHVGGQIAYITGLDPAFPGWNTNDNRFRPSDGAYTEVIHTNVGVLGYMATLADVDFYPNGGSGMPGCNSNDCDHARCYHYMAESLTRGGFTGRRCLSYVSAMAGNCNMLGSLRMGGLVPKTGQSGIFHLETNSSPPFSRG